MGQTVLPTVLLPKPREGSRSSLGRRHNLLPQNLQRSDHNHRQLQQQLSRRTIRCSSRIRSKQPLHGRLHGRPLQPKQPPATRRLAEGLVVPVPWGSVATLQAVQRCPPDGLAVLEQPHQRGSSSRWQRQCRTHLAAVEALNVPALPRRRASCHSSLALVPVLEGLAAPPGVQTTWLQLQVTLRRLQGTSAASADDLHPQVAEPHRPLPFPPRCQCQQLQMLRWLSHGKAVR